MNGARKALQLTKRAEAQIATVYLAGTNTRRAKSALFGLFRDAVGKDVVTRAWHNVMVDRDACCARGLKRRDFIIVDGAPGLETALTALCRSGCSKTTAFR